MLSFLKLSFELKLCLLLFASLMAFFGQYYFYLILLMRLHWFLPFLQLIQLLKKSVVSAEEFARLFFCFDSTFEIDVQNDEAGSRLEFIGQTIRDKSDKIAIEKPLERNSTLT